MTALVYDCMTENLAGVPADEVFELGVEWERIRRLAELPNEFEVTIRAANAERITGMLRRCGRYDYRLFYLHNDPSEAWMGLHVAAKSCVIA